jgi:hypothetical protein
MQLSGEDDDIFGTCSMINLWWLRNLAGEDNVLETNNCYEPLLDSKQKIARSRHTLQFLTILPVPRASYRASNIIVQMTRLTLSIFGGVLSNTCDLSY